MPWVSNLVFLRSCLFALACMCAGAGAAKAEDCTELYVIRSPGIWSSYNSIITEVMIKPEGDGDFRVRGILFNGDWGVMKLCAPSATLKVQWLVEPASRRPNRRRDDDRGTLSVKLSGRDRVYVSVARDFAELTEKQGRLRIEEVERFAGHRYPLARQDFETDRYELICISCAVLRDGDFPAKPGK